MKHPARPEITLQDPASKLEEKAAKLPNPMPELVPKTSNAHDRILRAAIALFAKQGYHRTPTRDIARVADVREVTLFRCFESKEHLFLTALRSTYDSVEHHRRLLQTRLQTLRPEAAVEKILSTLFDMVTLSPEILQISAVALIEVRGPAREECFALLAPWMTVIQSWIAAKMETGAVLPLNPTIVATGMAFTALGHSALRSCLGDYHFSRLSPREVLNEYSTFWTSVLTPQDEATAGENSDLSAATDGPMEFGPVEQSKDRFARAVQR